jgi:hypothetical protein
MGQPGAKQGDKVIATDTHIIMIPTPGGPVPEHECKYHGNACCYDG